MRVTLQPQWKLYPTRMVVHHKNSTVIIVLFIEIGNSHFKVSACYKFGKRFKWRILLPRLPRPAFSVCVFSRFQISGYEFKGVRSHAYELKEAAVYVYSRRISRMYGQSPGFDQINSADSRRRRLYYICSRHISRERLQQAGRPGMGYIGRYYVMRGVLLSRVSGRLHCS